MGLWVRVWVQACALPNDDDENVIVVALVSLCAVGGELSRGGGFTWWVLIVLPHFRTLLSLYIPPSLPLSLLLIFKHLHGSGKLIG